MIVWRLYWLCLLIVRLFNVVLKPANLQQWLSWQETLHPKPMDLGLERLALVLARLGHQQPSYTVITVAGTNGKGSSVAFLEAILRAAGYRVGAYTSPHLLRYNERVRVNGVEAEDSELCQAFAYINRVREDISLTYFEFGTLAALELFQQADIDVALLEVGLGGRLDAVNVLDADAALISTIGLDHQDWLGSDRNSIGREKAGVLRSGRPAVCADPDPPVSVLQYAQQINATLYCYGKDYDFSGQEQEWCWWSEGMNLKALPLPVLQGTHQLLNAAGVLMLLQTLAQRLPVQPQAIRQGLMDAQLWGRFQVIPGPIEWILDVTHNVQGASVLAQCLAERPCKGRTHAVLGMLADKDVQGVVQALKERIDEWHTASLDGPRGCSAEQLAKHVEEAGIRNPVSCYPDVEQACRAAAGANRGDRVVVFGSFHTVAAALQTDNTPLRGE